ncbi:low-temperature-induced 65 kDa protein-like [Nicotiana tomentosiformis]|uniref:low-temperature-induced 65 kDa protein-like n=1 Tax=Nicotiana tomentosiformis TaxID=4098 RepID=UPI00388CA2D5
MNQNWHLKLIKKLHDRQHPRADPVVSEKHVVPTSIKHEVIEQDNKETLPDSPSKTITETVTEKLAPAYAAVSDATHAIASKFSGLTLTNSNEQESGNQHAAPKTGHFAESNVNKLGQNVEQNASGISSPGKWDKGVSVKEYFVEIFEPGEGERSLSQIITEAMSPRQAASGDKGIVEKMKGAVTSFIRPDDAPKSTENSIKSSAPNNIPISTSSTTLSPKCPSLSSKNIVISTNDNLPQDNPIAMPHKSLISTTNETAASLSHIPEFHSASSSPLINSYLHQCSRSC